MMTREDMLRELELLPVWQLRTPMAAKDTLPSSLPVAEPQQVIVAETVLSVSAMNVEEVEKADVAIVSPVELPKFRYLACEDGHWLFVLPDAELSADEQHLLANIFRAMRLKLKPKVVEESLVEFLSTKQAKLVVCMGETTAQAVLKSAATIDELRARPQQFEALPLIVTYDVAHLLNNLPDKAKAWTDLRLAMQLMLDIKQVN